MKLTLVYILIICGSAYGQIDSINYIRAQHGLPPLKESLKLQISAKNWLINLERHDRGMVHDFSTRYGEVLTNSVYPTRWWMGSPSHRRVLLGRRWTRIGIAKKNGVYCARLE